MRASCDHPAMRVLDVHDAIAGHSEGSDLNFAEALSSHRLHRIAPDLFDPPDSHLIVLLVPFCGKA